MHDAGRGRNVMLESCPTCECELTENCCGETEPYERNGKQYCCRGCAVDGECACGCARRAAPVGSANGGSSVTPLL
jgi:hypothetical protein